MNRGHRFRRHFSRRDKTCAARPARRCARLQASTCKNPQKQRLCSGVTRERKNERRSRRTNGGDLRTKGGAVRTNSEVPRTDASLLRKKRLSEIVGEVQQVLIVLL